MATIGNITFHNAGTCPLFFMYALVPPGSNYDFKDIKLNWGILKGGRQLFYKIPTGYQLDWRFSANPDVQNVVTQGKLEFRGAIGQTVTVGVQRWA